MNRRLTVAMAVLAAAGLAASPASFAAKPKKKPITGTYKLSLPPDPSSNFAPPASGQCGNVAASQNAFSFTAPAAGTLKVTIDSADYSPGTPYVFDWDVFVNDAEGELGAGNTGEAHDEVLVRLKKKTALTFLACNINGLPDATVTYTFTYA